MKRFIIILTFLTGLATLVHSASWEGIGTIEKPFLISTARQFAELADEVNNGTDYLGEYFSLTNNIDLSEVCSESKGDWTPIGTLSNYFNGTLLGNNYSISDLYINNSSTSYQGLFGYIGEQGTVTDLNIISGYVYSKFWNGAIAAANNGVISNCKNIGCKIEGLHYTGGICGANFNTITNCTNQADVSCLFCGGGICAYNYGTIISSSNKYSITAYECCGGICGYNGGFGDVSNCYNVKVGFIDKCQNTSSLLGNDKIGGITGKNDGFIINSSNKGDITGAKQVGGIAGLNGGLNNVKGNISNSFNNGDVTGRESMAGGIVGYGNQESEIYNVYTFRNVHILDSPTTYIGEENGVTDNCFSISKEYDASMTNSITEKLNKWINDQPEHDLYLNWSSNSSIYPKLLDSTLNTDTNNLIDKYEQGLKIYNYKGYVYIISPINKSINIYSLDGKKVRSMDLTANSLIRIDLVKGVYIIENKKVIVY